MNKPNIIAIVLAILALVAFGVWFFGPHGASQPVDGAAAGRGVLYWYDPMKPEVHFDKPGKSPFMDMQLVPKVAGGSGTTAADTISIDPRMMENLGIRTARVERGKISQELRTTGVVAPDENRIEVVQSRAAGWVERLHVRAVGDSVRKGELLAEIYSPDLLAAERELLVALHASGESPGSNSLLEAARVRLSLLGLSAAQIRQIEKSGRTERRVDFRSPISGVVTELGVREGAQVTPGMSLFSLVDLSHVWVTTQITESQANGIAAGQSAEARVVALPGRVFAGQVEYVYPDVAAETRTLKARIALENPHLELKPGMYADVTLSHGAGREALLVPSEALIRTGTRSTIILAEGGGRFLPVEVTVGAEADDKVEIVKGLQEGQAVVASGQFLIDSEANLRGAFSQLIQPQHAAGAEARP